MEKRWEGWKTNKANLFFELLAYRYKYLHTDKHSYDRNRKTFKLLYIFISEKKFATSLIKQWHENSETIKLAKIFSIHKFFAVVFFFFVGMCSGNSAPSCMWYSYKLECKLTSLLPMLRRGFYLPFLVLFFCVLLKAYLFFFCCFTRHIFYTVMRGRFSCLCRRKFQSEQLSWCLIKSL